MKRYILRTFEDIELIPIITQEEIQKIQENKKRIQEQTKKDAKIYTIVIIFILVVFTILLWK